MARFQRPPRQSSRRPNRGWAGLVSSVYTNIPAASRVLLGSFVPTNAGIDLTVLRTVGGISVVSDNASAGESQIGAFGMIMVTDWALAAGVASVPDPVSDVADDWFIYQGWAMETQVVSAVGINFSG